MRLSGRVAAAIEILDDLAQRRRPISVALKEWAASHRFAGSKDRAAIGNLVYDAERRRASHAYVLGDESGRSLVLATLVFDWGLSVDDISTSFEQDKFAPEPLSESEQVKLSSAADLTNAPAHAQADLPEWLIEPFQSVFGESWIEEAQALTERPPLDMRVNTINSGAERVIKSLKRFSPEPTKFAPNGLRIGSGSGDVRTPNVQVDESFQKGWIEIQDEGSQIVSQLSGAGEGDAVLDLCAGGGGKTLALAAQMNNRGQIYAYDIQYARLAPIYERLKRANVRNVQVKKPEQGSLDDLIGAMSHVIVDAPCSGAGTWRRHPDAKWRLTLEQLATREQEQREVLTNAKTYVKAGGRLVYITCSVLPSENDGQMDWFLNNHAGFSVVDSRQNWAEKFGEVGAPHFTQYGVLLTPRKTGTDGFYCAILQKDT